MRQQQQQQRTACCLQTLLLVTLQETSLAVELLSAQGYAMKHDRVQQQLRLLQRTWQQQLLQPTPMCIVVTLMLMERQASSMRLLLLQPW
jgi:hypothetical protein